MQGSLIQWGKDAFEKQRVCFITTSDHLAALMEYGGVRYLGETMDKDNLAEASGEAYRTWSPELFHLANDTKSLLLQYQIQYDIFSIYEADAQIAKVFEFFF